MSGLKINFETKQRILRAYENEVRKEAEKKAKELIEAAQKELEAHVLKESVALASRMQVVMNPPDQMGTQEITIVFPVKGEESQQ